jgi:outer membrane protein OmpA-like peptidoglycan-associated protein
LVGDVGMDAHLFRPAVDSKGYISTNGTNILGDGDYSFGLVLDAGFGIMPMTGFVYGRRDTVDFDGDDPTGFEETDHLIDAAITGTLHFNYGIANTAVVGVQVPIMVLGGPNVMVPEIYNDTSSPLGLDTQGFGNITLHGKLRMLRYEQHAVGLAGILHIELPTGESNEFRGEPGFALWPVLALDWVPVPELRFGLNAGYRFNTGDGATMPFKGTVRPVGMASQAGDLMFPDSDRLCEGGMNVSNATCPGPVTGGEMIEYDDLLTGGVALAFRFAKSAELVADAYAGQIASSIGDEGSLGLEAIGGLKIYVEDNSYLVLAGGIGPIESIIFEPSIGDRDGDGYKDDVDECPDDPEDFDRFQDEDGCPEPDNDRDGILDVDDECPLVPEDHDGDADDDGCPEGSEGDRDGDGILDNVDKCPDDPEDRDGFQDEDGCPDPDNDKDRILDVDDSCPNDPETYNGFEDEDGCPDRGSVIIEENQIIILEKIYFATDSAEILQRSYPIVDAVAATLIGNPQITLVEVQGHADERGADDYNIRLTADRAASVVQALGQRGVDLNRLRSAGYGERCPIDPAHNATAWDKNRRVEFKIIRTDAGPTGVEVACPAGQALVPQGN